MPSLGLPGKRFPLPPSPLSSLLLVVFLFLAPSACSVTVLTNNATYPDRIAAFGPRINSTGVTGTLISMFSWNITNVLGCDAMDSYPNVTSWIALVERGDCTFLEKVRSMQNAGAIAVIVGDNKPSASLVTMYATEDSRDIVIPSVFVTKATYDSLVVQAAPMNGEYVLPVLIDNAQIIEWPMLDIVIVTIIAPAVIMIFLYSIWRFRRRSQQKREVAPPSVVISLPVRKYTKPEKPQEEEETCPICLEDFKEGEELRILPCRHEYHVGCVDQWLTTRKRFCPLCKVDACPSAANEESRLIIRNLFSNRTTPAPDSSSEPTGMHLQEDSQRNTRSEQELSHPPSDAPSTSGAPPTTSSSPSSSSAAQGAYKELEDDRQ